LDIESPTRKEHSNAFAQNHFNDGWLVQDFNTSSLSLSCSQPGPLHHHKLTMAECLISTDQRVNGDCCQSESDPATFFLGDLVDVSNWDQEAVQ